MNLPKLNHGIKNNVIAEHIGVQDILPPGRCVGKSTALALRAIAHALQYPGTDIQIVDHVPQTKAEAHTALLVERYIHELEFVGFQVYKTPNSKYFVKFNLYPEKK